ncbi:Signal transduction histidine kinase [Paenibacillaceae bacterium GAS479]|nr:Signal transduction histidine kinase [Paenibacillaceae bacterium GAS479]
MKLFLRQQIQLICFVLIQISIMLLVVWFDGYKRPDTLLYAAILGIFIMGLYLLFHYLNHRKFYERLSQPLATMNDSFQQADSGIVSISLKQLLDQQYRYYQLNLKSWESKQAERLVFMNQWVHQMKTPLAVIELITQEATDARMESISEETERLRHGLEMVLYMSRLETFEQDFQVEKVNLLEVVNEVITDYKRLFIRSHVYPHIEIDPSFKVETDSKWLRFMLQQILSNAIKYSAGSDKKINLMAFFRDSGVILEIQDRGIGIAKTDLTRVFNPFFTGENGRKIKESTGMGLYLVKEVVRKLNHEIEIESELNEGTTVRIIFPYAQM